MLAERERERDAELETSIAARMFYLLPCYSSSTYVSKAQARKTAHYCRDVPPYTTGAEGTKGAYM
jgi:hypothetical protein